MAGLVRPDTAIAAGAGAAYKGFYAGYCTPYAARQFDKKAEGSGVNWRGNGGQWYGNAHSAGWQVTKSVSKVVPGSIIVWKRTGRAGHVAVVSKVTEEHVFIKEMNWRGRYQVSSTKLPRKNLNRTNYRFEGFILPEKKDKPRLAKPTLPSVMVTEYLQIPVIAEPSYSTLSVASSETTTVAVKKSVAGTVAQRGQRTKFTAQVRPGFLPKGSKAATLRFDRFQNGKWVQQFSVKGTVTTSCTKCDDVVAKVALEKGGRWRVRATTPTTGQYKKSSTAWSYFTVR